MKFSPNLVIFISVVLVLVFKLAFTGKRLKIKLISSFKEDLISDAAALINEESVSANSNNDESSRMKKDLISLPVRRHPFKYGVLGKRYAYGYLGKRTDGKINLIWNRFLFGKFLLVDHDMDQWLDFMRERRAGRPQYGMLG